MSDMHSEAAGLVNDDNLDNLTTSLHPLADELMAIATRLRDAARSPDGLARALGEATPTATAAQSHLALARRTYALRRKRSAIFGNAELFGEPAWDILLDLFIAQGEGKQVSVSSACIGSAAPPTTGLRWLGILSDHGLIEREADPADLRRVMVRLTHRGLSAMERFFDAVRDGS